MALHRPLLIACFVLLSACTQAEDEACQVNSDCEDGLVCSISGLRGTCLPPGEGDDDEDAAVDAGDATVDEDVSVRDGSADDGSADDGSADDDAG
jgi:hypothetical protein